MAPEILDNTGYDFSVDWWALGTLIYEMLSGEPPFKQKSPKFDQNILFQEVDMKDNFTKEAADIIQKFLNTDPELRLGSGDNGFKDIKAHPFFEDINWKDLENKLIVPPFVPDIEGDDDVSHFDKTYTSQDVNAPEHLSSSFQEDFIHKDYYRNFSYCEKCD